ncbi:MAG: glycosyltransferase family 39 protein [Chloroflexi bacterium]|nr:glycosyltransferase family 39 protein [Chloroflexota bacterium]
MNNEPNKKRDARSPWLYIILLVLILVAGAYLRLVGLDWDEEQHLHPDERFLTMVESSISPVESLGDFFNTAESSLNPHNRGHGFFVYGTMPIFIIRYVAEWLGNTGYGQVYLVGRALSALIDLAVVWLVFLTASRLYDRRVGILGSAFYAFAVLPIQQSHFFTVDTFINFFTFLAVYFAVEVMTADRRPSTADDEDPPSSNIPVLSNVERQHPKFWTHPIFWPSVFFGLALGMAVASKINAAPVALVLPGAAILYLSRLSPANREREVTRVIVYVILAGLVSILTFRIMQPYAFSGPGFFGLKPNSLWIENINSLRAQAAGDVDFPPALQWARRPVWFSWQNLTIWGLGLPLGILAWVGFLWMGWKSNKGEWQKHILLWGWTALYFTWQSLQWNSTMRYQLPIYPTLVIFAAWFVFALARSNVQTFKRSNVKRLIAYGIGGFTLLSSILWAFSFTRIYTQPHPRVEASRWMFQNFPGPITLDIQGEAEIYHQPLPFSQNLTVRDDAPHQTAFIARYDGTLSEIQLPHVLDNSTTGSLLLSVSSSMATEDPQVVKILSANDLPTTLSESEAYSIGIDQVFEVDPTQTNYIRFEVLGGIEEVDLCGPLKIQIQTTDNFYDQVVQNTPECIVRIDQSYTLAFIPEIAGTLINITPTQILAQQAVPDGEQTLSLSISTQLDGETIASAHVSSSFTSQSDYRGDSFILELDQPVELTQGDTYYLDLSLLGGGELALSGAALANETTWDDGLPLRMDGYDPYGGIYQGGLNFEMYWDDNEEKLGRFTSTLAQADYLLITSSRQWGTTTRVPERYPLSSEYYRQLLGCPVERGLEWCYTVAEPGDFEGNLGFELVQVFQSKPSIGAIGINDQFSEEAFTVYDHPKVFVFQKTAAFDPSQVEEILGSVDLTKVVRVTPRKADTFPGNLMLPPDRLAEQRSGGTWSELFNPDALHNRFQPLGVVVWYLSVFLLGLISFPLVRFAMPGLDDHGYPLARTVGLIVLSYLVWLASSAQVPFNRITIGLAILLITLLSGYLAFRQKDELRAEWGDRRNYFLLIEGLFLLFFLIFLFIRLGNPDLWHPWKGGEKPMDFSYFNAVLKSTSFPPYDPWFAGGYINYYYYGFVIVSVLVKFLGIVPSFAYNLILPTLFAMVSLGAFSIVWNLVRPRVDFNSRWSQIFSSRRFVSAIGGALAMSTLGNLGILRMVIQGYQRLAVSTEEIASAGIFSKFIWLIEGLFKAFSGTPLPYRLDEWYWNPSRVIGAEHGNPITEFPFFTFLYADLHAHMIALPIALIVVAWALSVVLGKAWERNGQRSPLQVGLSLLIGGLAIGAMYPVNLSDIYTYLPLGAVAVSYAIWRYWQVRVPVGRDRVFYGNLKRLAILIAGLALLVLLSNNLYQPYSQWYSQGYSELKVWLGSHTPASDYLTHWGLFLFVVVSWMFYETVDWMAKTPVSALRKLEPHRGLILGGIMAVGFLILALGINLPSDAVSEDQLPFLRGVHIIWFVLPLALWTGVLLLRPGTSDAKRFVLFLIGTSLILTLTIEIVYVIGDIGRMNSVFKFYMQAWTFLSVSAAAAFGWILSGLPTWKPGRRLVWQIALIFLVASAALYPMLASFAKIEDRMADDAPNTLDGMTYMQYATYHDEGVELVLSEDYNAIRWMQDNIVGSPVIVEANQVEYHWGTRYTIYTGLPGVVGWNWHMRQQRTIVPHDWIYERVDGVHEFYRTEDIQWAREFLERYDVSYIVLGQFERAKYPGPGLDKFPANEGVLWTEVFRDGETVIYQVNSGQ